MGENLIVGIGITAVCLAIQCFIVAGLLDILILLEKKQMIKTTFLGTALLLIPGLLILLAGNILQMALWAGWFLQCGEFADFSTAFYHSVVNFTTLGYGDVVMSEKSRLLGALEAGNGVLMFGITTAFLYTVFNGVMERYWDERITESNPAAPDWEGRKS